MEGVEKIDNQITSQIKRRRAEEEEEEKENDKVLKEKHLNQESEDERVIGPSLTKKKKLEVDVFALDLLPNAPMYERSFMHKSTVDNGKFVTNSNIFNSTFFNKK